jgi:hypothetical protein
MNSEISGQPGEFQELIYATGQLQQSSDKELQTSDQAGRQVACQGVPEGIKKPEGRADHADAMTKGERTWPHLDQASELLEMVTNIKEPAEVLALEVFFRWDDFFCNITIICGNFPLRCFENKAADSSLPSLSITYCSSKSYFVLSTSLNANSALL